MIKKHLLLRTPRTRSDQLWIFALPEASCTVTSQPNRRTSPSRRSSNNVLTAVLRGFCLSKWQEAKWSEVRHSLLTREAEDRILLSSPSSEVYSVREKRFMSEPRGRPEHSTSVTVEIPWKLPLRMPELNGSHTGAGYKFEKHLLSYPYRGCVKGNTRG